MDTSYQIKLIHLLLHLLKKLDFSFLFSFILHFFKKIKIIPLFNYYNTIYLYCLKKYRMGVYYEKAE